MLLSQVRNLQFSKLQRKTNHNNQSKIQLNWPNKLLKSKVKLRSSNPNGCLRESNKNHSQLLLRFNLFSTHPRLERYLLGKQLPKTKIVNMHLNKKKSRFQTWRLLDQLLPNLLLKVIKSRNKSQNKKSHLSLKNSPKRQRSKLHHLQFYQNKQFKKNSQKSYQPLLPNRLLHLLQSANHSKKLQRHWKKKKSTKPLLLQPPTYHQVKTKH